jgi:DNA-binding MarR family transcriptional regulator/N-acetylglutamate synthase-like GNAT family acetyltransferase
MSSDAPSVAAVRRFNRFYTKRIGVLQEGLLASPFSLAEARVLYELAQAQGLTAAALAQELGLDPGYLSRILKGFAGQKLIERAPSASDGRASVVALTAAGRKAFARLDARSGKDVALMLRALPAPHADKVLAAMRTIEVLLGTPPEPPLPYLLRPHRPGDLGWIVSRHGALYAEEFGWSQEFEAFVAEIAAKFIRDFDAARECCWIAERDGERVGSVALVAHSRRIAKLRLLLVEPAARGLGIGRRLVDECIGFARRSGYREIALWTTDILDAARAIYRRAGFRLVSQERHHSFGHDLVGEDWRLKL